MSKIFVEVKSLVFEKLTNEIGIFDQNVKRTCTHKITNLPTQVNISNNLYFLWNCNNMYILLILEKDKYLIYSLRVTERGKCGHSILRCKKYTKVKKVIYIILIYFLI